MTTPDTNVLGVYFGHNASIALAQNGRLIFALSEERVRKIKNYTGFPSQAYELVLQTYFDGDPEQIDYVVFPSDSNQMYYFFIDGNPFPDGKYFGYYNRNEPTVVPDFFSRRDQDYFKGFVTRDLARVDAVNRNPRLAATALQFFQDQLRLDASRFKFINHHAAHAYAAGFNLQPDKEWLIFTLDGSGDNLCASVNRFSDGEMDILSTNPRYPSLGRFYREVTAFLGLKPDEHEFKVMGLAPYAKNDYARSVYDKFAPLLWVDDELRFQSQFPMDFFKYFLLQECVYDRFDNVASAAQRLLEDRVCEWVSKWIERTDLHNIALGGGVFMNVKLNQKVGELPEVEDLFVVPSAGDESTAIGSAYYGSLGSREVHPIVPVKDLDLGCEYSNEQVEQILESAGCFSEFKIEKVSDIEARVAGLLSQAEVVGRVAGRSEWGARALGNRSLLADPRSREVVRVINEMIKGRDFWMPFAPSILEEDCERYLENPKGFFSPYMGLTFNSTPLARKHLPAALHPYDSTTRPQIVVKDWNPRYHRLISCFKELTSVGGILNTSLNLHGDPNTLDAQDAINVLRKSDLKYLAIENWLVSKPA